MVGDCASADEANSMEIVPEQPFRRGAGLLRYMSPQVIRRHKADGIVPDRASSSFKDCQTAASSDAFIETACFGADSIESLKTGRLRQASIRPCAQGSATGSV